MADVKHGHSAEEIWPTVGLVRFDGLPLWIHMADACGAKRGGEIALTIVRETIKQFVEEARWVMWMPYDPDEDISVSESHTCSFHQEHPGALFVGCTCWTSIGSRKATPEEYRERRVKRLADRRKVLKHELAAIDAELGPETRATGPEDEYASK